VDLFINNTNFNPQLIQFTPVLKGGNAKTARQACQAVRSRIVGGIGRVPTALIMIFVKKSCLMVMCLEGITCSE